MKLFVKLVHAIHDGSKKHGTASINVVSNDSLIKPITIESNDSETIRTQIKKYCDSYAVTNPDMSFMPVCLTLDNEGFSKQMVYAKTAHELDYIKNMPVFQP